jgi:hypothetical protein
MKEVIEIAESEDEAHLFVATFQEPSVITTSGTGPTPVASLLNLISELTTRRDALALQRDVLSSALLEELLATEELLAAFWDT